MLSKLQRDLIITFAIGGSVVATVAGVIIWINLPAAVPESTSDVVAIAETPPPIANEHVEQSPVAEPKPDPEPEPDPEPAKDPIDEQLKAISLTLDQLGIPSESHRAIARLSYMESREAWMQSTQAERVFYCLWIAHKRYPSIPHDVKAGMAVIFQDNVNLLYANAANSSAEDLITLLVRVDGDELMRRATKTAGAIKVRALDDAAHKAGRVLKVEVLAKWVEYETGKVKVRITNNSNEEVSFLQLQMEMTLSGKHVGACDRSVAKLLPASSVIETFMSDTDIEQFDDYSLSISRQPRDSYYAIELVR